MDKNGRKTMEKKDKMAVVENATARQALAYSLLYGWVFWRSMWRTINSAAHSLPWVFVGVTVAVSTILSTLEIGKARAERDSCNHRLVTVERQLNSYKALYDGKEARP